VHRVLFISSMGGHLEELRQLKDVYEANDSFIVTESSKTTEFLKDEYPDRVYYLAYGTKHNIFPYIFKFAFNIVRSCYLYIRIHPDYIITTGTHTAVPMCFVGKMLGSRIIYIETFANINKPTVTGRIIYGMGVADKFIVQWKDMLKYYPKAEYGGSIF